MQQQYAYQDLFLRDRKRELWKPIAGFEDFYEVSSHGRIKSLSRKWMLPHGGIRNKPIQILSPRVVRRYNKQAADHSYSVIAPLYLEGIAYCHSVARLVYNAFVAPLDLKDRSTLICFKDGDGRNLNYRNLEASNISKILKRSYEKGRAFSETRKPISQFDTRGNLIATYASLSEAGAKNGFDVSSISSAVHNGNMCKGFLWQQGRAGKFRKGVLRKHIDLGLSTNFASGATTEPKHAPPAADLSPATRKGERWKDFPGYEGLYQISNMGRVKALGKVSEGNLKKWYPERIKMLTSKKRKSKSEDRTSALITTLCKGGKKKNYLVARYVYCLFVEAFDLSDPNLRVRYKDGDAHNLEYRNLYLKEIAIRHNKQD
ncbi:NUMOD4 motif-containing protein [Chitinophaga eiseniae]|uniref:NUMOD4 motif-containing protein n=1 Tax=Chitinophaga eiseniae TaxID=634771 RepID=A0A1T4SWS4_9BACT|nr:NUMOD4 domain-containing protein [Chitinophaga eiseniae]SKA32714.1 NUMOD4 motif-containing protein [Chitinophaga eiseniae]